MGVTSMDRKIAGKIAAAHKPCVIAMNKWDLVEEGDDDVTAKLEEIRAELFFLDYAPAVLLSAKTGEHVARLFKAIDKVRRASKARIGTGPLNRLLGAAITATPPPSRSGRRFKILYGTQLEPGAVAAVPPPQFLLFVNDAGLLPDNYRKHLEHKIRDVEPFPGLPLLLRFRGRPPRDGRGKR
jgi:GTP-binding protein